MHTQALQSVALAVAEARSVETVLSRIVLTEFFKGREAIKAFLRRKWAKELDYRLKKELWAYTGNRISVRFEYEWRDADTGQWFRTHGNEHWEFDEYGLMRRRDMSANDYPIRESDRRYRASTTQRGTAAAPAAPDPSRTLLITAPIRTIGA